MSFVDSRAFLYVFMYSCASSQSHPWSSGSSPSEVGKYLQPGDNVHPEGETQLDLRIYYVKCILRVCFLLFGPGPCPLGRNSMQNRGIGQGRQETYQKHTCQYTRVEYYISCICVNIAIILQSKRMLRNPKKVVRVWNFLFRLGEILKIQGLGPCNFLFLVWYLKRCPQQDPS